MLPGVELARRRRVHYHGDMAAGDHLHAHAHQQQHHHHHQMHYQMGSPPAQALTGVAGPALAARNRLEEKLRGAALPSSRWGRLTRERQGGAASRQQNIQRDQQQVLSASTGLSVPCRVLASSPAELRRTLSKADLCAVCLDEVRERQQRVTRLPCSHKYHSDCVLPWLAIQPDCPCCRTLVPSVHTLLNQASGTP